jgi:hypothetical protein
MDSKSEQIMATEAADVLEQLARDLRAGRVALGRYEMDVEIVDGLPTGRMSYVVGVTTSERPRRDAPPTAKVDGITIGPVLGFGVDARFGDHVEMTIRCLATYDEVETLARLAAERGRAVKARMTAPRPPIAGGDVGVSGG